MKKVLMLLVVAVGIGPLGQNFASAHGEPSRPNILVIVTDDQRAGNSKWMPATTRIFQQGGVDFKEAFVTTPVCCPARASLMTGRYVHNHGVKCFCPYDLDQATTVQRYLQDAGYRTAYAGKFLNNWNLEDDPPSFDSWATFPQSNGSTYSGGDWNVDGNVVTVGSYSTDFIAQRASSFFEGMETQDGDPWALFLSTPAAHAPWVAQEQYAQAAPPRWNGNPAIREVDLADKPPYVRKSSEAERCDLSCARVTRRAQYRTLLSVDDLVDNVFGKLNELGENQNTLAIYLSDNGLMWGEHGWRSGKRVPYTQSVQIPLMIRWPEFLPAGADSRPVANIDIAPTILDAANIPQDLTTPMDGVSLLAPFDRKKVLLEHWRAGGVPEYASLRGRRYQYVEYYSKGVVVFREYYNLQTDPWQLTNLLRDGLTSTGPSASRLRLLHRKVQALKHCQGANCN